MDNQIEQSMQMLLANMSTYYQEEINLYNNRIDYIINEIDSIKYMRIQEFYVIPGREKEVEKVVHEANIFLKSKMDSVSLNLVVYIF